jgi:general secretion pathway protein C
MLLRTDGGFRALLRQLPQRYGLTVAEGLLIAVLAVQGARAIWAVVTPVAPLGAWEVPAATPAAPPLPAGFDAFNRNAQPAAATITSLGLTLVGTRVDTVSGRGSAIIGSGGVEQSYAVGDEIAPGVTLAAVAFDSVTLDRGGAREMLYLDQSATSAPVVTPGDAGLAPPAPLPAAAAGEVTLTPRLANGQTTGFTVAPAGSGELFRASGLQAGDVVIAVDGTPVGKLPDPATTSRALTRPGATIEIERDGRTMTLRLGSDG